MRLFSSSIHSKASGGLMNLEGGNAELATASGSPSKGSVSWSQTGSSSKSGSVNS